MIKIFISVLLISATLTAGCGPKCFLCDSTKNTCKRCYESTITADGQCTTNKNCFSSYISKPGLCWECDSHHIREKDDQCHTRHFWDSVKHCIGYKPDNSNKCEWCDGGFPSESGGHCILFKDIKDPAARTASRNCRWGTLKVGTYLCYTCNTGYYFDLDTLACAPATGSFAGCWYGISSEGECDACNAIDGFYDSGNGCVKASAVIMDN